MSQPPYPPSTPGPEPGPGPTGNPSSDLVNESVGFLRALFDFRFHHFVTPVIVRFVYLLATIGLGLLYFSFVVSGFASDEPAYGLFALIGGAIGFVLYLALIRMGLEVSMAMVRMSEEIHKRVPPR